MPISPILNHFRISETPELAGIKEGRLFQSFSFDQILAGASLRISIEVKNVNAVIQNVVTASLNSPIKVTVYENQQITTPGTLVKAVSLNRVSPKPANVEVRLQPVTNPANEIPANELDCFLIPSGAETGDSKSAAGTELGTEFPKLLPKDDTIILVAENIGPQDADVLGKIFWQEINV